MTRREAPPDAGRKSAFAGFPVPFFFNEVLFFTSLCMELTDLVRCLTRPKIFEKYFHGDGSCGVFGRICEKSWHPANAGDAVVLPGASDMARWFLASGALLLAVGAFCAVAACCHHGAKPRVFSNARSPQAVACN